MAEDKTVGGQHQINVHEFEQTLGDIENREAWYAVVHGVTNSQVSLSA